MVAIRCLKTCFEVTHSLTLLFSGLNFKSSQFFAETEHLQLSWIYCYTSVFEVDGRWM